MRNKKNLGKLFGVLVMGGAMMAQAEEVETPQYCQVELQQHQYNMSGKIQSTKSTCLDEKEAEEIAELVEKALEKKCLTPFCGCWLG